jgi:hypothetical protein
MDSAEAVRRFRDLIRGGNVNPIGSDRIGLGRSTSMRGAASTTA